MRINPINDVISNVQVYGLNESIKRSKYPKSTDPSKCTDELTNGIKMLGKVPTGTGHDQFLTGIIVQFDLTFTKQAWSEAERYHFLDFISSCSTVHKISKFNLDECYIKYTDPRMIEIMKEKVEEYNNFEGDEAKKKELYKGLLYSNPCGFQLTAGMTTNYRQLKTIYQQRKNHILTNEWGLLCEWIETLPMFKELCLEC